jgi:phosphomannomutase
VEPAGAYLRGLSGLLDLEAIRSAGWRVVVDAMHGAGAGYLGRLLRGGSTRTREIRGTVNPAFPGMHNPEPVAHNLQQLSRAVVRGGARIGLALDGDADRLGVVDASGRYLTTLQVFPLLAYYFLEVLGLRGAIVKSLTTSSMIWRLGEKYGVPVRETGVGFKKIAPVMVETNALMGGEESGGYAFRGHIPERDGILSGLYLLDFMARTGKDLAELLEDLYRLVGPHHFDRLDVPFDPERRDFVQDRVAQARPGSLAGLGVTGVDTLDGFRFSLEGGSWSIVRFSGTEPLVRIYAESPTPALVQGLLASTRELAGV